MLGSFKRVVVGRPIASYQAGHHKFGIFGGLAVLSADALSSVAYATEEVLRVLMIGGLAAMTFSQPISILIAILLIAVGVLVPPDDLRVPRRRRRLRGRRATTSARSAGSPPRRRC